jgi:hypothetical protein
MDGGRAGRERRADYSAGPRAPAAAAAIAIVSPHFFAAAPFSAPARAASGASNVHEGGDSVKNGTRSYENCIARCAHGFRCRRIESRVDGRRCALMCAGSRRSRRPSLWSEILRRDVCHDHR